MICKKKIIFAPEIPEQSLHSDFTFSANLFERSFRVALFREEAKRSGNQRFAHFGFLAGAQWELGVHKLSDLPLGRIICGARKKF